MTELAFDPANAPWPYSTEDGEPYVFPIEDYPTEETVKAWLRYTSATSESHEADVDEWTIRRGQYLIHDHDEDYEGCQRTPDVAEQCPEARRIDGWWAE